MFFSKKKDLIGIDIGSSSVKLMQLKEHEGVYQLLNVGIVPLPPEAIVDNTLMDSSSVVEAVKSLVKSLDVKVKEVACSISGNTVIIRKIKLPAMPADELEDQIQWEAEQYIPFDINDVNIDFQILEPDEEDPSRMDVLLVASKKEIVNDYVNVFTEAGLKLMVVDVDSFAVQNAFELNYEAGPEEVVALINIGANVLNLNIVKGGISLFTRDVQMGGNLFTEEIQKQLGLSSDEAEQVKITGNYPDKGRLQDVIAKVNETLAIEMRRSLDFYNTTAGEGKIGKVYLSGGAAKTSSLSEVVQNKLGLPVEMMDPLRKIVSSEKEFDPEYLREIGPFVTVAVGLATRRVGDKW
ncbi:type IV pilus assembly protein PilM [Geobacter sp.]|uniref:type IV pilus biogenesis protein PilM n=1 Tax=Geobacter sp. TaxID=46610 RepID=UPI0026279762|nr:type IV pilus assembly protein PilM [Geobacter sp.]